MNQERVIILGGTRGLGRAIAVELVSRGIEPLIIGRSVPKEGDSLLSGAVFIPGDLKNEDIGDLIRTAYNTPGLPPTSLYWVAGEYHRGALAEQGQEKIDSMIATHITGPIAAIQAFHVEAKRTKTPYNLIVIGSVFVHKPGKKHAVLAAAKAFKANFCRVFSYEMAEDLPGSGVLLVNPWAMKTGFFEGYKMDDKVMAQFMDPAVVASVVCSQIQNIPKDKKSPILELTLDRGENGSTKELFGPQPVTY